MNSLMKMSRCSGAVPGGKRPRIRLVDWQLPENRQHEKTPQHSQQASSLPVAWSGFFLINRRSLLTLDFDRAAPVQRWLRAHRTVMACRFEVVMPEEDARHVDAALVALDEADRIEAALTIFRKTSELSRINSHAAASPAPASEELFALLKRCETLHAETDGVFDITSTPLSRRWGFLKGEVRARSLAATDAAT